MADFNRRIRGQRITVEGPGAGIESVAVELMNGPLGMLVGRLVRDSDTSVTVDLADSGKAVEVADEVERLAAEHSS